MGILCEVDAERFAIAVKELEDDDVEPGFLRIAYNWSRTRAVQGYVDSGTAFDPEAIQNAVSEVNDSIDRFSTIQKKTTSIRKTANEIDEELEEIEGEVKSELAVIRMESKRRNVVTCDLFAAMAAGDSMADFLSSTIVGLLELTQGLRVKLFQSALQRQ